MDFLARRSHFRAELVGKLTQRGYDDAEIESTLDRLTEQGYVDDRRTAEEFVRSRLARQPTGRRRLRHDLARRGVDHDLIDTVLTSLVEDDEELASAREAAERWWARRGAGIAEDDWDALQTRRAALARHLERRGFPRHAIVAAMRELRGEVTRPAS